MRILQVPIYVIKTGLLVIINMTWISLWSLHEYSINISVDRSLLHTVIIL